MSTRGTSVAAGRLGVMIRAAAAAERQRGCQPGGAGAKDRCVAGCSGHPSHGGG